MYTLIVTLIVASLLVKCIYDDFLVSLASLLGEKTESEVSKSTNGTEHCNAKKHWLTYLQAYMVHSTSFVFIQEILYGTVFSHWVQQL